MLTLVKDYLTIPLTQVLQSITCCIAWVFIYRAGITLA